MPWSMLQGRVEALRLNLERARDLSVRELALDHVPLEEGVWDAAFDAIRSDSVSRLWELEQLSTGIDRSPHPLHQRVAWQKLAAIQEQSEDIFRECLELMGGLTFRERDLDNQICTFADELINECARSVGRMLTTIAIPAHNGGRHAGARHIAHVQFPEWDVWTLPLVTFEYGQVAITDRPEIDAFARKSAIDVHHGLGADQDVIEERIRALLSDAFATYTLGPAYACALMLLRLDFVAPDPDCREFVAQRVAMVRGILARIADGDVADLHDKLGKHWDQALHLVLGTDPGAADPLERLALDPATVFDTFNWFFLPQAAYAVDDWDTAVQWGSRWCKELRDPKLSPAVPAVAPINRLRDALNASWYARIHEPAWVTEGADVTRELCQQIIDIRGRTRRPPGVELPGAIRPDP
ncbi:hypothetical protein AB0K43_26755 [Kitasatospora sp. NPDC049258]|uniref:hypothetical protein n=1 Tax=Kitasatospora sp. NPDC049258 TaxID=3155394 RepID=UPI0034395E40